MAFIYGCYNLCLNLIIVIHVATYVFFVSFFILRIVSNCEESTTLIETHYDSSMRINNRRQIDVLFSALSKAFDPVSHVKLINKLKHIMKKGPIIKWIEEYLRNRLPFVCYKGLVTQLVAV